MKSLDQAEDCLKKQSALPPVYVTPYLHARFLFDIQLLEESILSDNKSSILKHRKNVSKSRKTALKTSNKYALFHCDILRLVGLSYWLMDGQNKAVTWWERAIEAGERLRARPDLARTYMEIGRRFLEENSKYKELNGISAKEYLEKARSMWLWKKL